MSQTFAIAPGTQIVNSASIALDLRGRTYVVSDADTLVAASDSGNSPPHALHLDSASIPVNALDILVGRLAALDPDVGDTLTYTVDDSRFLIVSGELRLSPDQLPGDGEQVTLTITASDVGGLSVVRHVSLRASRFISQRSAARIGRIDPLGEPRALSLAQCGTQAATGISLGLPANYNVVHGDEMRTDEPVVLEIVDADANVDRAAVDGLFTRLTGADGDEEVIRLLETGIDTGVFTAGNGLMTSPSGRDDCRLAVRGGDQLRLDYVDARDALDRAVATAPARLRRVQSTTATIALLANANGTIGELTVHVEASRCAGSVGAPPRDQEGNNILLPAAPSLQPSSAFLVGDTVFVRVTDLDENRDSATREQLEVVARAGPDE